MHAVLYTHQIEPITVVDIPMFLWERLAKGETIVLAVMEPACRQCEYARKCLGETAVRSEFPVVVGVKDE